MIVRLWCGTAWGVRRSEPREHQGLVFCSIFHAAEIAVFLPYLPAIAVPLATKFIARSLELLHR
jgi:hypothetical protein